MRHERSNEAVKLRMLAAQMRHHASTARDTVYRGKFERAAAELDGKADEAERGVAQRLDS